MTEQVNPETGEITEATNPPVAEEPVGARGNGTQPCTLWEALARAQSAIEQPVKSETAEVKNTAGSVLYNYKYAPLDSYLEAIKQPFADNGLYLNQRIVYRDGKGYVCTTIFNSSGECIEGDYPILVSGQSAQNFAGGVTYARRYGLMLAVGLFAEKDDDANAASGNIATITQRDRPQTEQSKTQDRRSLPQTQTRQPDPNRDAVLAARDRVRGFIAMCRTTADLNKPYEDAEVKRLWAADEKLIKGYTNGTDKVGERVWATLMDEEAAKRLEIANAEVDKDSGDDDPFGFMDPRDTDNALR